jgi:hypothetical protein
MVLRGAFRIDSPAPKQIFDSCNFQPYEVARQMLVADSPIQLFT